MDATQRETLAAHIRASADPDVVAALAIRNDTELARLYNLDSTFYVWRTRIDPDEYREAMDWTEVDNLTAGKARIWEWITQGMTLHIDASRQNVRAGLNNAWNNTDTKTALLAIASRFATVCEQIFATGTGTEASPGTMDWEGAVTIGDIGRALNENP